MSHAPVPQSSFRIPLRILLTGAVCLLFGAVAPTAFGQSGSHAGGGGSHGGASHASLGGGNHGGGHSGAGHATLAAGSASSAALTSGSTGRVSNEGNRAARFYGASGERGGSVLSSVEQVGAAQNAGARFFGASSAPHSFSMGAIRGENTGESSAARGFTRSVFAPPLGQAGSQQNASGQASPDSRYVRDGNSEAPSIETIGHGQAQVIVNSSAPVRYELVGREWVVIGEPQRADVSGQWSVDSGQQAKAAASGPSTSLRTSEWLVTSEPQQQRPTYTPPAAPRPMPVAQAPRPIVTPPQNPIQTRPPVTPVQMPVQNRPVSSPASPPIARVPGQPVQRFPIAQPPPQRIPIQPIRQPILPVTQPMVRVPGQPVMHFPMVRPPISALRMPGTPAFHPVIAPPGKSPLFHPAAAPPGRMPIRRIGSPGARPPFIVASEAPPIRKIFDGMTRSGAPFIVATAPPHFDAHPCFQTITNCGFGFGFDGDFDFDDGFFFGFPFGSPFFFGPFGFPAFGFGFGPNCFFNGIVEPCGFTPLGFAQFQAFGPNGWGWSWLGLGNGWFYSPPEEPPAPPWNSTETNPGVNLQYFTNEWYLPAPYSEPEAGAAPQAGNEQGGAQQNQNVVTEIVTTDDLVFGVTSYWMQDNQLCYVTTYKIKNCIPMTRVDLQKTVDMNYKRGVKFTLTPEAPASPDSQKQPPSDQKQP